MSLSSLPPSVVAFLTDRRSFWRVNGARRRWWHLIPTVSLTFEQVDNGEIRSRVYELSLAFLCWTFNVERVSYYHSKQWRTDR